MARLRPRHCGRRHQWHGHRSRRCWVGGLRVLLVEQAPVLSATRLRLHQARPWGTALSRAGMAAAGSRGAHRARGDAAHGAASHPAAALRAAARAPLCAQPGCCAWGCSSTIISAGGRSPPCLYHRSRRSIRSARRSSGHPDKGFEYSDCFADDLRLVVLNAVDAAERGAVIRTRTRCIGVERGDVWRLVLYVRGPRDPATARVLVNAPPIHRSPCPPNCIASDGAGAPRILTRAATSWCRACSTTIAPPLPDRATTGWSSRCRSSGISR